MTATSCERAWRAARGALALGLGFSLLLIGACQGRSAEPSVGGDTHWLSTCDADHPCEAGICHCGICTRPCDDDDSCPGAGEALCVDDQAALEPVCGAWLSADQGVCLRGCEMDAHCATGQQCQAGLCIASADARAPGTQTGLRAEDFAGVPSPVSFEGPVPLEDFGFDLGDAARELLGQWAGCGGDGCFSLRVRGTDAGETRGELVRTASPDAVGAPCPTWPEQAPEPGKPPSFPDGPGSAREIYCDYTYQLYDTALSDTRVSLAFTAREPWTEWCEAQPSYRVEQAGQVLFQCMDPDAVVDSPDLVELQRYCDEVDQSDCTARRLEGAGCGDGTPCRCDEVHCDVDWQETRLYLTIAIEQGILRLRIGRDGVESGAVTLERVP